MIFNPQAAGNKGVPEPRVGHEQRKVIFTKYQEAITKGWSSRLKDTGERYMTQGCVIMERKLDGYEEPIVRYVPIHDFAPEVFNHTIEQAVTESGDDTVLTPDDNDTILVTLPDFPEAVTFGDTKEDALVNAEDAIEEVVAVYKNVGKAIPKPRGKKK